MGRLLRVAAVVALFAGAYALLSTARARDLGQWDGQDDTLRQWFISVMQPDNPYQSCCGEADAYWADEVKTGPNGELIAVITDDRDDAPLRRAPMPIGTQIVIPPHKIQFRYGNPTGHIVVFLSSVGTVYCYIQNGGV